MISKKCIRCNIEWPLHFFGKHFGMKDGRLNKCKRCCREYAREHRQKNLNEIRQKDRERFQNNPVRRKYAMENMRQQRIKYPEKYKARTAVSNAVRDGRLLKMPCSMCGNEKSTAHHEDYSRPLDVVWVCLSCHAQLERK